MKGNTNNMHTLDTLKPKQLHFIEHLSNNRIELVEHRLCKFLIKIGLRLAANFRIYV